jgi:hypothetical protein
VTVVGPSGFNLKLNGNLLTLNKGYRLRGFRITSGDPSGTGAAIKLDGVGTSLENMKIDCEGLGTPGGGFTNLGDRCIEVTAATRGGTITLEGLEVVIKGNKNYTAGIVHRGIDTTLRVVGSTIRSTGNDGKGVVGVLGLGVLSSGSVAGPVIVQSSTVNLESITSGEESGKETIAVWLNVGDSEVLGPSSQIKLNGTTGNPKGAIGIKASHSSGTVTVKGTTFETQTDGVGIGIYKVRGSGSLSLVNNTFPTSRRLREDFFEEP